MKVIHSSIFRAICTIVAGFLLIEYREEMLTWLTIIIGVMFGVSGLISCIVYFAQRRRTETSVVEIDADRREISSQSVESLNRPSPMPLVVGIGSMILGSILVFMNAQFINYLVYVFSAILAIGALSQMFTLASATKMASIGWGFWIMPVVILLVALIAIIHPQWIASAPLLVIGWALLLYGVSELIEALKVHTVRKAYMRMQERFPHQRMRLRWPKN